MKNVKGVVIKTDSSVEIVVSKWDYEQINEVVGGYIECIYFGKNEYFAFANENAKLLLLPQNVLATKIWYASGYRMILGDYISGDVVFFGGTDDEGDSVSVTDDFIEKVYLFKNTLAYYPSGMVKPIYSDENIICDNNIDHLMKTEKTK